MTRGDIAGKPARNPGEGRRQFRVALGTTPQQWILSQRLDRAARLLTETDLPLKRVGEESGLGDQYYFSRLFQRRHGLPPGAWRRRKRML